jgi:2-aminoethylphosphonate-pyruvate transaminase
MVNLAVILAAGLGSRMKGHTAAKPKGLLEIGNEPIIERSIGLLKTNHIEKIIIGTGYLSDCYEELAKKHSGIFTIKNDIYAETGSFYTLYNMKDGIDRDFLLLESDLLYEERAITHLLARKEPDIILASGKTDSSDEVYIETDQKMCLVNMSKHEKELNRIDGELVGISRISLKAFQILISLYENDEAARKKIEYESALIRLSSHIRLKVDRIDDLVWTEIDTQEHLKRAKEFIYPRLVSRQ